jgi:hypothetical protein
MIIDNDGARSGADSLAGHGIRKDSIKPRRIGRHIVFGGKIDGAGIKVLTAVPENIQLFEIRKKKWRWHILFGQAGIVECRVGIVQLSLNVGRQIEVVFIKIY